MGLAVDVGSGVSDGGGPDVSGLADSVGALVAVASADDVVALMVSAMPDSAVGVEDMFTSVLSTVG
jgi:hypothetical protein